MEECVRRPSLWVSPIVGHGRNWVCFVFGTVFEWTWARGCGQRAAYSTSLMDWDSWLRSAVGTGMQWIRAMGDGQRAETRLIVRREEGHGPNVSTRWISRTKATRSADPRTD